MKNKFRALVLGFGLLLSSQKGYSLLVAAWGNGYEFNSMTSEQVVGNIFLAIIFPPWGLILDEAGKEMDPSLSLEFSEKLPFLKDKSEGKILENLMHIKVRKFRNLVRNHWKIKCSESANSCSMESLSNIESGMSIDEMAGSLSIKLDEKLVRSVLEDGDYTREQINTSIQVLCHE